MRINDLSELEIMMSSMSEECKQRVRDKADRLEVFFKDGAVYMKDKDEEWCDGMLPNETTKEVNNEKY